MATDSTVSSLTIGPYRLTGRETEISTHEGARFVGAALGFGELVVWTEFDPSAPECVRTVSVIGSGDPVPAGGTYVGTVIGRDGSTANHVYDTTTPPS